MKSKIQKLFLGLLVMFFFVQPVLVNAQSTSGGFVFCGRKVDGIKGACKISDLITLVYILVNYFIGMAGFVALCFIVWGGMLMLTSAGNKTKIDAGKATIRDAITGLILTFLAYIIVSYVASLVIPTSTGADPLQDLIKFFNVK